MIEAFNMQQTVHVVTFGARHTCLNSRPREPDCLTSAQLSSLGTPGHGLLLVSGQGFI